MTLPKCAVLTCPNTADPRRFARDVNDYPVMICDGHNQMPKPSAVARRSPDLTAWDLAGRIVRSGYSPTPSEVLCIAHALLAAHEAARVHPDVWRQEGSHDTHTTRKRDLAMALGIDERTDWIALISHVMRLREATPTDAQGCCEI
jgi:hypothetical protein